MNSLERSIHWLLGLRWAAAGAFCSGGLVNCLEEEATKLHPGITKRAKGKPLRSVMEHSQSICCIIHGLHNHSESNAPAHSPTRGRVTPVGLIAVLFLCILCVFLNAAGRVILSLPKCTTYNQGIRRNEVPGEHKQFKGVRSEGTQPSAYNEPVDA